MIFDTKEGRCIHRILEILDKGPSRYAIFFKESGVSHSTLQTSLKELIEGDFIKRNDLGHMNVHYNLEDKGKKLLRVLMELRGVVGS